MSGTEFILSPMYDMSDLESVFIVAKMGYTDQYIRLQGKKIVMWPKDDTKNKSLDFSREIKEEVQNFILSKISLENVENQYLDFLFVYGVEYKLRELTDRIYEVYNIDRIYELVSTLAKTAYFREGMTKHVYDIFQNNQRKFIDYISADEDRYLDVIRTCMSSHYHRYKMFHEMFEKGMIVIPDTVFACDWSYTASSTFEKILSLYLSQTLEIPVANLNRHNCCQETNRIAVLYRKEIERKWPACWIFLGLYGLDVDVWYTMGTYLSTISEPTYTTVLMWIKESPPHNHCDYVKYFVDNRRQRVLSYFTDRKINNLREMFIHLTLSEYMDEIIDTAYYSMLYLNVHNFALFSYKPIWKIYYVVEFYFRKHKQEYSEQELIRQRCMYIEPGPTDDPDTINVTIDLSEQNGFTNVLDTSLESVKPLLSLDGLCIKLMIGNRAIVLNNKPLNESTLTAIRDVLRDDMLPSVKIFLLLVAIHYRESELIKTLLIHGADPTARSHYAVVVALEKTSEIAELILDHSLEAYNMSSEICENLLLENCLEEPLSVKIDLLLRYGISWQKILKKYILEVFNDGALHPVLHDHYISSGITLSSFLLETCLNYVNYYKDDTVYKKILVQTVKWDIRFFPDTTINDLITQKHLDYIQRKFLYEYYNTLLSEGLDPRHLDDYMWREACQKSSYHWIGTCLYGDTYADPGYVKRSETLGENDNWAIKTALQIDQQRFFLTYLDGVDLFLERNVSTLDVDTMIEISRIVKRGMSSEKIGYAIRLRNQQYIDHIYDIMDRYRETHPTFSFEKHTSILIE